MAVVLMAGCKPRTTATLTPDLDQRFQAEGVLHRADDQAFRYTEKTSSNSNTWENREASIIVTRRSVYLHKNEKVGIDIVAGGSGNGDYEVHKDGERVLISSGNGRSKATWSFAPPSDAAGWTTDIRSVIKGTP
ncbi:MAG: hypothetical protein ABI765_17665 [Gemmatimonadota bacterium]